MPASTTTTATSTLSSAELSALVARVFQPRATEKSLAFLVDLPDRAVPDNPRWRERRALAAGWARALAEARPQTGLDVELVVYRNVRMNNADLPDTAWRWTNGDALPPDADALAPARAVPLAQVLQAHPIFIAPTEFSATAPLKLMAPRYCFRAATMPGFAASMIPALRLDYGEINRRVELLRGLLDRAEAAEIAFDLDGGRRALELRLDLRHREGHASGGLVPQPGSAGNLPSGEAYVVPYEGERAGEPSQTNGLLPVQFDDEVVVYRVVANRAVGVEPGGPASRREAERLAAEPAYGNLAELGLGVLADFGVEPCGELLLDEKLGLHIAFGRSDHFGGQVGARQFSRPGAVVHIDRVFLRSLQPRVALRRVDLTMPGGAPAVPLMRDDRYVVDFAGGR